MLALIFTWGAQENRCPYFFIIIVFYGVMRLNCQDYVRKNSFAKRNGLTIIYLTWPGCKVGGGAPVFTWLEPQHDWAWAGLWALPLVILNSNSRPWEKRDSEKTFKKSFKSTRLSVYKPRNCSMYPQKLQSKLELEMLSSRFKVKPFY